MARPLANDLTGRRFGMLTVTGRAPATSTAVRWSCRCDCGTFLSRESSHLLYGTATGGPATSCGCDKLAARDLTGKRFGKLVVISRRPGRTSGGKPVVRWACRCDCGSEVIVRDGSFRSRRPGGCKCVHTTHGGSNTPTWRTWLSMRCRCNDPKYDSFPHYGGRGIRVCRRWNESFSAFREDAGERPSRGHTLDRVDGTGHYSCGHCEDCQANGWAANTRWATRQEQSRNLKSNRRLTAGGRTLLLVEWAALSGLSASTIVNRLDKYGWAEDRAVTTPAQKASRPGSPRRKLRSNWGNMIHRCYNPKSVAYPRYGGRGVRVCRRWKDSFENYLLDVGLPQDGLSIDRIDNDGGYWCGKPECPECGPLGRTANWRWATRAVQANNKSNNRRLDS